MKSLAIDPLVFSSVSVSLGMTIWAEKSQILKPIVAVVAIDMIQVEAEGIVSPAIYTTN